ncbi:MAG: hypothetical protein AAF499_17720, partial [Pseudomonadota bacterium]
SVLVPVLIERGVPLALLGTSAPAANLNIISRSDSGDIAIPFKGGMPDMIYRSLSHDPDMRRYTVRYTATPVEAMQLFMTGDVAAAFLAEPLSTLLTERAPSTVHTRDLCTHWRAVHRVAHCAATGAYVATGLPADALLQVRQALAAAVESVSAQPTVAAMLIRTAFPSLRQAPLERAFGRLSPAFQPTCPSQWLRQTLDILSPFAPFSTAQGTIPLAC